MPSRSRSREAAPHFRSADAYEERKRHDNHARNDMRSRHVRSPPSPPRRRRDDLHLSRRTPPVPREERGRYYRGDDDGPRNHYYDRRNRRSEERQQRTPRGVNRGDVREAPRHQQIAWGKQITRHGMTPEAILALFEQNGYQFSARNLATAVHRIGKLGGRRLRQDPRLERLIEMCGRRIGDFEPQQIANCAWGCAKIGITDPRFFKAVSTEVPRRIGEFQGAGDGQYGLGLRDGEGRR